MVAIAEPATRGHKRKVPGREAEGDIEDEVEGGAHVMKGGDRDANMMLFYYGNYERGRQSSRRRTLVLRGGANKRSLEHHALEVGSSVCVSKDKRVKQTSVE
jgi:hypothetical protein